MEARKRWLEVEFKLTAAVYVAVGIIDVAVVARVATSGVVIVVIVILGAIADGQVHTVVSTRLVVVRVHVGHDCGLVG